MPPTTKKRSNALVTVFLLLKQEDKILLHLRQNSGFADGQYGLIAGHVEEGESATAALVREAFEEANLIIDPSDLRLVQTIHHKTDRNKIHLCFECSKFSGMLKNCEPDKCGDLAFYPLTKLPPNTMELLENLLENIANKSNYLEWGF